MSCSILFLFNIPHWLYFLDLYHMRRSSFSDNPILDVDPESSSYVLKPVFPAGSRPFFEWIHSLNDQLTKLSNQS